MSDEETTTKADAGKPSAVEKAKLGSNFLCGAVPAELLNEETFFTKEASLVLKHHGMYQQDDRDLRGTIGPDGQKLDKVYSLMVRTKIPSGILTSDQLLAELDLCDEVGNGTIRITNRQDFQLHAVPKKSVHATIRRINEIHLTTLGGCGDVLRNVMCCPSPINTRPQKQMQEMALKISSHLLPRSKSYHDIWLTDLETGERHPYAEDVDPFEVEPLYGRVYMPRKFKIALSLAHDNCVDVYTPDLGMVAVVENDEIIGYNFLTGGSFGMTPSNKKTFPALGKRLAFVPTDQVFAVTEAVMKVQRDHGNRSNRNLARMKYLIASWGMEKFRATVEEYYGQKLAEPHPEDVHGDDDHLGWHDQLDGNWFLGVNIDSGRILDREGLTIKSALREICHKFQPGARLTPQQNILLTDIKPECREEIESILRRHGIKLVEEISTVRRWSMSCVALPTCPLAITESERVLPEVVEQLEVELARLSLSKEKFTLRMTGCPNGCARPYNAEVGISGRAAGKYAIYLGGRSLGDRLSFLYQDLVPLEEVVPILTVLLTYFKHERQEGESFGDFCFRKGAEDLSQWSQKFLGAESAQDPADEAEVTRASA